MKLACLCPTYKRPECLANAAACFQKQWLCQEPEDVCRLFIIDDAGQHLPQDTGVNGIALTSHKHRHPSLPEKYQALIDMANRWGAEGYVIWEDDDVFLPWHLSQIHRAFQNGVRFYRTPEVWSNYMENRQGIHLEGAVGRFHSSWAFTRELYEQIGGYPQTTALNFDQQLGALLRATDPNPAIGNDYCPGYVYRWGNTSYHGSAHGDSGYTRLWQDLAQRAGDFVGEMVPAFDPETEVIWQKGLDAYAQFREVFPFPSLK